MHAPVVSVVMPTFNRAHLVGRAIESVLAQTYQDFELLVIDDGSGDATAEAVQRYRDPRMRLVRLPTNRGLARARNAGIQAARGEWIAFLDDDDVWLARRLERQMALMAATPVPHANVGYCLSYVHDEAVGRRVRGSDDAYEGDVLDHLLGGWCPTPSMFAVKRSALVAVEGFDEALVARTDWDLWLRLAQASHRFVVLREPMIVKYENAGAQLTSDPAIILRGFGQVDRKWGAVIRSRLGERGYRGFRRERLAAVQYAHFMRARMAMAAGHRLVALKHCAAMFRYVTSSRTFLLHGLVLVIAGHDTYRCFVRMKDALLAAFRRQGRETDAPHGRAG